MAIQLCWQQSLRSAPGVLHQRLGEETVLLNLRTEHYYGLDAMGTRIWQLLTSDICPEQIVSTLLLEYDVCEAVLRADVLRIVTELLDATLLEAPVSSPAAADGAG